ncbi:hypothetical protein PR202_gb28985 [Eleusine coracana subsp. coracana]|uniref:Expansin n=1 Tax=Eleusine coracana subsp. coracana TaxID=191504 RepID=A0AAV5FVV3_ELECO|nr:hypothetical protein QOZ80_8BG0642930 [Eleusine coracana subsp. coracana]GJN39839.1 hypothetical protein PR202_gb28985 [Eleusine coracana subsp. coracana]
MDPSISCCFAAATTVALLLLIASPAATADPVGAGGWEDAHATFYGDETGAETMQGACGYGNLFEQGYGLATTALSSALFNDGWSCGACYELQCQNSTYCKPIGGGASVTVTATNACPANYSKPNENWCNPPQRHFDLSKPMFMDLVTDFHVGIIPVKYRRVPCVKSGGVRFEMMGNEWWVAVLVYNVAGAGEVRAVAVKGDRDGWWMDMHRNWGQIWDGDARLIGQGLSFRVTTGDGRAIVFDDVVPPTWTAGQSFKSNQQFVGV